MVVRQTHLEVVRWSVLTVKCLVAADSKVVTILVMAAASNPRVVAMEERMERLPMARAQDLLLMEVMAILTVVHPLAAVA
jgi:hypothetical protein